MKRFLIVATLVVFVVTLAGCAGGSNSQKLAGQNYKTEQAEQQKALARAQKQVPVEYPGDFDDRRNINERNVRLNDPNKITYIYELAWSGQVVLHDTAKGPITPCSTQILPDQGPVRYRGDDLVVPQPEPNGTFAGSEADCIFYFTPQGAYREWVGGYFMSDQPLSITNPVQLVVNAKAPITRSVHAKTGNDTHK